MMTFKDVANEWFEYQKVGLSYAYVCTIEDSIEHFTDFLGEEDITNIKPLNIQKVLLRYANDNPHTHKPSSKKLLALMLHTVFAIYEFAIDNEYCSKNPVRKLKVPPNSPKTERQPLTEYEQKLVLSSQHRATLPAMIMLLCGLRKGEVIPLQWEDIDYNRGVIYVNKSVSFCGNNEFKVKGGTKNGKSRIVVVPHSLLDILQVESEKPHSVLITGKLNGTLHTPSSFDQMWTSYEKHLNYEAYLNQHNEKDMNYFDPKGVPQTLQHITPHMLRHTYATLLYASGVDVLTASKLMGHSNADITLKIYTHLQEATAMYSITNFDEYVKKMLATNQ